MSEFEPLNAKRELENHTPRSVLVIYGTNPSSNFEGDLEARLVALENHLVEQKAKPDLIIYLGGVQWEQNGQLVTEALNMQQAAHSKIGWLEIPEHLIEIGQETISQTDALVEYVRQNGLEQEELALLTSWHQIARASVLVLDGTGKLPRAIPVFNQNHSQELLYDFFVNFIAGVGYTSLVVLMRKFGKWESGGPLIDKISDERLNEKNPNFLDTIKK